MQQTSDNSCSLILSKRSFNLGLAMQHPKENKYEKNIFIPQPEKKELIDQRQKSALKFSMSSIKQPSGC